MSELETLDTLEGRQDAAKARKAALEKLARAAAPPGWRLEKVAADVRGGGGIVTYRVPQ